MLMYCEDIIMVRGGHPMAVSDRHQVAECYKGKTTTMC